MIANASLESIEEAVPARRRLTCSVVGSAALLIGLIAALAAGGTELLLPAVSGSGRVQVDGLVWFDGQAIPAGVIEFVPQMVDPEDDFVHAIAEIRGGEFELPAECGLVPGCYLVRIRSEQIECHASQVAAEEERGPGLPCLCPAPFIMVRRDANNRFEIRLK